jgi:diguanylate cyclase (GGDEF)-like protein
MLEFFVEDAERFFENYLAGTLSSGIWQEDKGPDDGASFVALAAVCNGEQIIVIRLLREEFAEQVAIVRKARMEMLEKRALTQDLALYREKSRVDALTCILNRDTFMETLHAELERRKHVSTPLALLMVDIDHFKAVNDEHGHLVGDAVLRELGKLLVDTVRRDDAVARFGGEEFILLIPRGNATTALRIGEKLRARIAAHASPSLPGITVSIGCAVYQRGESADELIDRADKALYVAKASGRNAVRLA